jgi:hypothetical protein
MSNAPHNQLPVAQIGAQFKYWIGQNQQLRKDKELLSAKIAELQAKLDAKQAEKKFDKLMGDVSVNVAHVDFKLF